MSILSDPSGRLRTEPDTVALRASDLFAPAARIERYMDRWLDRRPLPENLRDAVRYALLGPGKRLRPILTVRASDGSNFRIDDLTILYEVIPGEAGKVLHDSGPGTGFKEEWIKAYARSILRDEFGRYTAVDVADPTVYVFDDTFSALDLATEARLRAALQPRVADAAVLLIAQRVASIETADEILVLEKGEVVGQGTHDELLETCPTYLEIVDSQMREVAA